MHACASSDKLTTEIYVHAIKHLYKVPFTHLFVVAFGSVDENGQNVFCSKLDESLLTVFPLVVYDKFG